MCLIVVFDCVLRLTVIGLIHDDDMLHKYEVFQQKKLRLQQITVFKNFVFSFCGVTEIIIITQMLLNFLLFNGLQQLNWFFLCAIDLQIISQSIFFDSWLSMNYCVFASCAIKFTKGKAKQVNRFANERQNAGRCANVSTRSIYLFVFVLNFDIEYDLQKIHYRWQILDLQMKSRMRSTPDALYNVLLVFQSRNGLTEEFGQLMHYQQLPLARVTHVFNLL